MGGVHGNPRNFGLGFKIGLKSHWTNTDSPLPSLLPCLFKHHNTQIDHGRVNLLVSNLFADDCFVVNLGGVRFT